MKYGGRCAYCGCVLSGRFQVDHIDPKYSGGTDDFENLNPACHRCNNRKNVLTVDQFRHEISMQPERLRRSSSQYRLAFDFCQIAETFGPVVFYFEMYEAMTK